MSSLHYPLVSILVPVYQVEEYIERCARSLFEQTYDNLEFIFCDDCSTDASICVLEQVIKEYPKRERQIRILHHNYNPGISVARNTCLEATLGDYFIYVDSDDKITADCIEKLVEPLSEKQYDLVIGNIRTIGNDRLDRQLRLKLNDGDVLVGNNIIDTYRKYWNMVVYNKLCRTAFIQQQSLKFKEGLFCCEDELWCFQVACMAKSLRAVNRVTYIYIIRQNSITTSIDAKEKKQETLRVVVKEMRDFLMDRNIFSASAYRLVLYFFWRLLKPVKDNRKQFIEEYCYLRQVTRFPLSYSIKAIGFHPKALIQNLYYMMPSTIAARIIYLRNHIR